ncbi:hypothetical protein U1Q18_009072 [Sarracenia purpurea var. burkii]
MVCYTATGEWGGTEVGSGDEEENIEVLWDGIVVGGGNGEENTVILWDGAIVGDGDGEERRGDGAVF